MKIADKNIDNLKKFAPYLEHTSLKGKMFIGFLFLVVLSGVVALYFQIAKGHVITGMRDNVVWGLYIVNFVFFMGIGLCGALLGAILHLSHVSWRKPIIRLAELMAIFSLIIGPVFIILCVGRLDKLHHLFIFARIQSPITWDVIAIIMEIIGCLIFLYLGLIHNFAILRDYDGLQVPKWRKAMYRFMAINYEHTARQQKNLEWAKNVMAVLIIPMAIIVFSVLAWIFGMTKQAGWNSTIFGPYFVIGAIFSGIAALILIMATSRKFYKLHEFITMKHFNIAGTALLIMAFFYGYFTFSEYFTKWYGAATTDSFLISKLLDFSQYGWPFLYTNVIGILIPMIMLGIPRWRSVKTIVISALMVLTAFWIKVYLIIVPTLETPYLPIQDNRIEWIRYSPTWVEIVLSLAGLATFCLFYIISSKFVTLMPSSTDRIKSKND